MIKLKKSCIIFKIRVIIQNKYQRLRRRLKPMERCREMMPQTESIIRWNWVEEQSGADGLKDRVGSYVARVKWRVENY